MGVDEDWIEAEPSPYRSRVPTLVFYGSAPVCAPPIPPPLEPITRRLPVYDVSSSDLEDADLISIEDAPGAPDDGKASAGSNSPPPMRLPRGGKLLVAALLARRGIQLGALVVIAVLVARGASKRDAEPAPVVRTPVPASAPLPVAPAALCSLAGPARELAPRAIISGGVELAPFGDAIGVGFTASPREGMALRLEAASLQVSTRTKVIAARPIARVVPAPHPDLSLDAAADSPDGERTFFDQTIGATYGLGEDSTREALRAAPLPAGVGYAVAFRRAGAIWFGVAAPDGKHALRGPPTHVPGLGPQVGSPTLAVVGDVVVAAWADRAKANEPWRIRWLTWHPGDLPGEPQVFVPPAGGYGAHAMSPSLAPLGAHSFLLAWTEGPVARHQVRAQAMTLEGQFLGVAMPISEGTANAGQSQVGFASGGRGLVAFLASHDNGFAVLGTPLSCVGLP